MRVSGNSKRFSRIIVGACGSVFLHGLLLLGFLPTGGLREPPNRPIQFGPGAEAGEAESEFLTTLIFIDDPGVADRDSVGAPLSSHGNSLPDVLVKIVSTDPHPAIPPDAVHSSDQPMQTESTADRHRRALLFGRYLGQIRARIERAWIRPRTPIDGDEFTCEVQITQNRAGEVTEVQLGDCNGSSRWQLSLVGAIQSASPLPAPPESDVFTSSVSVSFRSLALVEGKNADGYEPQISVPQPQVVAFQSPTSSDPTPRPDGAVDALGLREIDSPAWVDPSMSPPPGL